MILLLSVLARMVKTSRIMLLVCLLFVLRQKLILKKFQVELEKQKLMRHLFDTPLCASPFNRGAPKNCSCFGWCFASCYWWSNLIRWCC